MRAARAEKLFVTGGTGFIGQALVRQLRGEGRDVVLLTRDPQRVATKLSRDVAIVKGDLADPSSFIDALGECAAVIHCAKSDHPSAPTQARQDVEWTGNLMDASIRAGVGRFLQLSTISVYGITPDGIVDETFPPQPSFNDYARSKIEIEEELLEKRGDIEVVILQPANVYGPGPCWWSHTLLNMMRRGRILMVEDGLGLANMVHVSDLVGAILLALKVRKISGERFIISDGRPVLWRDYFQALEKIAGRQATLALPAVQAKALSGKLRNRSPLMRARRLLGRIFLQEPITYPLADEAIDKYACRTVFSIEKAVAQLGYQPLYDLSGGLETVREFESNHREQYDAGHKAVSNA